MSEERRAKRSVFAPEWPSGVNSRLNAAGIQATLTPAIDGRFERESRRFELEANRCQMGRLGPSCMPWVAHLGPGGGRAPNRGKDPAGYDLFFFFDARLGFGGSSINCGRSPGVTSAVGELGPCHQASGLGLEFVGGEGVVQVA